MDQLHILCFFSKLCTFCNAKIDFIDIDSTTFNLCTKALEKKLIIAKKNNTLPKILIAVHLGGQSCDMLTIKKLSLKYNFKIIEDASHAIGGTYLGNKIGNCKYSDITIFSFHPVKIITTGEGGALITNNAKIASVVDKEDHMVLQKKNLATISLRFLITSNYLWVLIIELQIFRRRLDFLK